MMVVFVLLMSLLLKSKFVLFDELWTLKTAFKDTNAKVINPPTVCYCN